MSIIKRDDNHQITNVVRDLSPAARGALVVAAGGLLVAARAGAKMLVKQAVRGLSTVKTVRGKATAIEPAKPGRAAAVRIGRRVFRQYPDGTTFEENVEYTVQYVDNGDGDPIIVDVKFRD